ncbi:transglutaminase/protease-like cytokinesis protein 3 [Ruminiclostridium sufflavum DSM 19573]|uniref:Transglutaminase/protease-like cytokinesis protein 3 n=1 Tax=Ruminiclostridium sufflavum DSM 19573 TaxID=1121337 RepID=A0A318Y7V4_9FIRM|nr:copper amine oxidase N-terminal domain-containing protein [Ruminiclostridium sufflavum]PYG88234.1 transglutaminase/protease-like cytokinesis protein 3 [Ruminiclostridium sufflavum DSM 19573]
MKKFIIALIIALSFTNVLSAAVFAAQPQISVVVNEEKLDFPDAQPFVDVNGRTQTPAKYIGEALGASVTWNGRTKKAVFTFGDTELVLYIGKSSYEIDGKIKQMDTTAVIKDGRTFVPAKYIAEAFGADVEWDGGTKTVYVSRTLTSQLEEGKDIEDGTVVNNQTELIEVISAAALTLQPSMNIKCNNYKSSDYDLDALLDSDLGIFGARYISINWSEILDVADMTLNITYSQVHKIQQSMTSTLASDRLSSEDIEVKDKMEEIVSEVIADEMTDYEKELAIHDYLVANYKYDYENYKSDTLPDESYTPYGLLIKGTGVCQAYAEAMKLLLNRVGVECEVVIGKSREEAHGWNIVKLDDEYYMVDVTWDDPTPDEEGYISYGYFNVTSGQLEEDHSWDTDKWPVATGTKYNYFVYNNLVVNNYMEFRKLVEKSISEGKKDIVMYIYGYNKGAFDLNFIFNFNSNSFMCTDTNEINTVFRIILH